MHLYSTQHVDPQVAANLGVGITASRSSALDEGEYLIHGYHEEGILFLEAYRATRTERELLDPDGLTLEQAEELIDAYENEIIHYGCKVVQKDDLEYYVEDYGNVFGICDELKQLVLDDLQGDVLEIRSRGTFYFSDIGSFQEMENSHYRRNHGGLISIVLNSIGLSSFARTITRLLNRTEGIKHNPLVYMKSDVSRAIVLPQLYGYSKKHELRHAIQNSVISLYLDQDIESTNTKESRWKIMNQSTIKIESTVSSVSEVLINMCPMYAISLASIINTPVVPVIAMQSLLCLGFTGITGFLVYNPFVRKNFKERISRSDDPFEQIQEIGRFYVE